MKHTIEFTEMRRRIKIIYDFFRLWIMWGDRKEAWQDANTNNDPHFQSIMKEFDESINEKINK